ncbi:MAG: dihydrofolate reductase [Clostridia bacterium]|nr:dihydrofolate reductase [Clostridia bacterium]
MKLIAAVSAEWGIGKDNKLLFSIPADMKFFRETTKGHTVIMGRKTLESFPGGNPLKNRNNIVFSKTLKPFAGITVVRSLDELMHIPEASDNDAFVIGGESIYRLLLPYIDIALITKVNASTPADSFLPDFDGLADWYLAGKSDEIIDNGYSFTFCTYRRLADSERNNIRKD